jgi:lipoyl(octanoyl) transferase
MERTPATPIVQLLHFGLIPYDRAWRRQRELARMRSCGSIPDTLVLAEHPHTYTRGRSSRAEHLLVGPEVLEAQGVLLRDVDRGGDITYHGPGQLVGYPILKLSQYGRDLLGYLRRLEEVIIVALAHYGLAGARLPGLTGVWIGEAKIAAIGVKLTASGVTMHGFALNIAPELRFFNQIVPCGIAGRSATSLAALLGQAPTQAEVEHQVALAFADVFGVQILPASASDDPAEQPFALAGSWGSAQIDP